eukprot:m.260669 g.260669  ORF g.260669 m.260669 type:complete len:57 (-) comp40424_c0_seq1:1456-1626(-)
MTSILNKIKNKNGYNINDRMTTINKIMMINKRMMTIVITTAMMIMMIKMTMMITIS